MACELSLNKLLLLNLVIISNITFGQSTILMWKEVLKPLKTSVQWYREGPPKAHVKIDKMKAKEWNLGRSTLEAAQGDLIPNCDIQLLITQLLNYMQSCILRSTHLHSLAQAQRPMAEKRTGWRHTSSRLSCKYSKILYGFLLHINLFSCANWRRSKIHTWQMEALDVIQRRLYFKMNNFLTNFPDSHLLDSYC